MPPGKMAFSLGPGFMCYRADLFPLHNEKYVGNFVHVHYCLEHD